MGINTHYYTFFGTKHPFYLNGKKHTEEDDAFHDALYDGNYSGFDHVSDGMGGEYLLLGRKLFDSGDLRWNDIEDTWVDIELDKLPQIDVEWRNAFREVFPQYAYLIENVTSKLITFMHLS